MLISAFHSISMCVILFVGKWGWKKIRNISELNTITSEMEMQMSL